MEPAAVLERMEDAEIELAWMQDALTMLELELIGCEKKREEPAMKTMVWWLQNKMAACEEAQKLSYNEIAFRVSERDRVIMNLLEKITEKTMLLTELMGNEDILIKQNVEHIQEIDIMRRELN